ncbi:MAG: hypothetical protein DRI79_12865 [Chloroflexi bacterium]|nr:MAG: hypothetical protein DRI79_12865 [Chloroflexota bacterium]
MDVETSLFIRLYTDADVHGKLAGLIRQHGFDAVSAYEVGNSNLDDPEQLAYAASQHRAILTCNIRHFAPLFDEYWRAGREHYGIIVSEQLPIGEMLHRLLQLLNSMTADEMRNNYKNLAEFAERDAQ